MTAWASTFSVDTVGNNFIITRNGSGNETVYYRTVSLSAFAGVNYTERTGELIFTGDEAQKTIPVSETPCTVNSYNDWSMMYFIQTGLARTYRFELLDGNGSLLAYKNRDMPFPSSHQFIDTYLNKSVTDLVYFNDDGDIKSGEGNKYIDAAPFYHDPGGGWVKVTDAGYGQGLYGFKAGIASFESYIPNYYAEIVLGMKVYATVYFAQKEENDGYQYIQIIETDYNHYDDIDPDGAVNDPDISTYKACFELSKSGVTTSEHYQFFPHRYDYENKEAEVDANLSHYEFDYDNSYLWQQKFNSNAERPSTTGSLVFKPYNNHFYVRFDAAGNYDDNWYFKNIRARMALVDQNAPYRIDNCKVSGGKHCKGNTIYVSVPFNEMVKASSSTTLNTTWGTLTYVAGNGSNVLTFSGTISLSATGTFKVNSFSGSITDWAGNVFPGTISHDFDINLDGRTYSISYNLAGGSMPSGQSNPTSYTEFSAPITLNQPVRDGYTFKGWTGSNGNTPQTTVTIPTGTTGNLSYTANWSLETYTITYNLDGGTLPAGQSNPSTYTIETPDFTLINPVREDGIFLGWTRDNSSTPNPAVTIHQGSWGNITYTAHWRLFDYTYDSTTGELTLLWGEFNNDNKWGKDVPTSAVKSVTATSKVSFTGDCSGLFYYYFSNCTSIDLDSVNTANATNMNFMFAACSSLTSLNISSWNTENVTDMRYMFHNCNNLSSLDISGFNTANVTDMDYMFDGCSGLSTLNISGFNTENVTDMNNMFNNCSGLTALDVSGWNTQNVTNMRLMFNGCSGLTTLDLSGWNTANVTDMVSMFYKCNNLTTLDVSGWNTANVTYMNTMFSYCSGLRTIYAGTGWSTESVNNSRNMFNRCLSLVGGMGTTYNANHDDKEYARIDGGPDCPGYFTEKPAGKPGDVNGDGEVDVRDITALIDVIMNSITDNPRADVNGDGDIDVRDITALIDIIMNS